MLPFERREGERLMPQLPELVQALLDSKAYPETPQRVELVQTQMSFVFLTDNYVYKVKKPVNLGYLDYTTLDKRQFYCQKEVELNRRLCPEAYLGVVPITRDNNVITVDGQGEVIEYSVKMLRLPEEAMMDRLLIHNQVSPEMAAKVARKLAEFHQKAETNASISAFGSLDTITQNTEENFTQTEKYIGTTIRQETYQHIKDYTNSLLKKNAPLFHKRITEGRIRDCHGDLHAAHICFNDGICIYDCIEFNDRFRYCDVASEVAFLAMDVDHYGQAELSQGFVDAYIDRSQDKELLELLDFYKCYRAYVRGKVESFKLDDPYIPEEEKAKVLAIAKSYFELAEAYI
jgi:aminoglycoside phosphotransferase family enzyme